MISFMGIHWEGIDRLILLPIFIVFGILIIKNYYRVQRAARLMVHPDHQKTVFKNFSLKRQYAKMVLLLTGLVFTFIAILQPQWGKREEAVVQAGRDVLIVLDISRSMKAQDVKPTRLDFAKLKIRALLSKLTCERVGLIVFAGSAFVQCPLTADHAAFLMFLDHIDAEMISSGTTALDSALTKVLTVFAANQGRKNKLAIVLTDGEDFSVNLNGTQRQALHDQLHLFALGIGTPEGAPVPKFDAMGNQIGHETDDKGSIVLTKLNEPMLEKLCKELSGTYIRASYDDDDVDTLARLVARYEKEKFTDRTISQYHDQYPWFLAVTWICLALEWIL